MPIAQSRMIALINAALDYKRAAEQMSRQIITALQNYQEGLGKPEQFLEQLGAIATLDAIMDDRANSQTTISIEYYHFKRYAKRNSKWAQKQANRRAKEGTIPRARTPNEGYSLTENAKNLPPSVMLSRPKMKGLDSESQRKVLEEANRLVESGELDEYCPHCGFKNPNTECPMGKCKWTEYWAKKLNEDEDLGEFKL